MLRISIQESDTEVVTTLEGRLAGPWVAELHRAWSELAPRLLNRQVRLDVRNVTYSDLDGKHLLRNIFRETQAEILTRSQWSRHLAEEVTNTNHSEGRREV